MAFEKAQFSKKSNIMKAFSSLRLAPFIAASLMFAWTPAGLAATAAQNSCTGALGEDGQASSGKAADQSGFSPAIRDSKDYYAILGLTRDASADDIVKAKRKMNRKYHPDLNASPTADSDMRLINVAYDILSNPAKRAEYDALSASSRGGARSEGNHDFSDAVRSQGDRMQAAAAQAGAANSAFAAAAEAGMFGTWGPLGSEAFKSYLAAGNAATGMRAAAMPGFMSVMKQAATGLAIQKTVMDAGLQTAKNYLDTHERQQQQKALEHQRGAVTEFGKAKDWEAATKLAARAKFYNQMQGSHQDLLEDITSKFGVDKETVIYMFMDEALNEANKAPSSAEKVAYANNLIKPYLRELVKTQHGFEALLLFAAEYNVRDLGRESADQKQDLSNVIGSLVAQTVRTNPNWLPEHAAANMTPQQKLAYDAGVNALKDNALLVAEVKDNAQAAPAVPVFKDVPHLQPKDIFLEKPAATPADPRAPARKTVFGFYARETHAAPSASDSIIWHVRPLPGNTNPAEAMVVAVTMSGQVHFIYPDSDRVAYQLPNDTRVESVQVFENGRIGMTAIQKNSDGSGKPMFYLAAAGHPPLQFDLGAAPRFSASPRSTVLPGNRILTGWTGKGYPTFIAGADGSAPVALQLPQEIVGHDVLTAAPVYMPSLDVVAMQLKDGVGIVDPNNSGKGHLIPRTSSEKPLELDHAIAIVNTVRDYYSPYKNSIATYGVDGQLMQEIHPTAGENLYAAESVESKVSRQLLGLVGKESDQDADKNKGLEPLKIQTWDEQGHEQKSLELPVKLAGAPKGYKAQDRGLPHMTKLANGKILVTANTAYAKGAAGEGPASKDYLACYLVDPNKMGSSKDLHTISIELNSQYAEATILPMDESRFMLQYPSSGSKFNYVIMDADNLEKIYTVESAEPIRGIHFAGHDVHGAPRYILQYGSHLASLVVP